MSTWLSQHLVELLIATLLAIIAWSIRRFVTIVDSHEIRITALERDGVTRDQIDELRHSLMATMTQNHERTEQRLDRLLER
jgi:hypothetical protein